MLPARQCEPRGEGCTRVILGVYEVNTLHMNGTAGVDVHCWGSGRAEDAECRYGDFEVSGHFNSYMSASQGKRFYVNGN